MKTDRVNFDQKISQRLAQYKFYELSVDKIQELKIIESDRQFIRILKILNTSCLISNKNIKIIRRVSIS